MKLSFVAYILASSTLLVDARIGHAHRKLGERDHDIRMKHNEHRGLRNDHYRPREAGFEDVYYGREAGFEDVNFGRDYQGGNFYGRNDFDIDYEGRDAGREDCSKLKRLQHNEITEKLNVLSKQQMIHGLCGSERRGEEIEMINQIEKLEANEDDKCMHDEEEQIRKKHKELVDLLRTKENCKREVSTEITAFMQHERRLKELEGRGLSQADIDRELPVMIPIMILKVAITSAIKVGLLAVKIGIKVSFTALKLTLKLAPKIAKVGFKVVKGVGKGFYKVGRGIGKGVSKVGRGIGKGVSKVFKRGRSKGASSLSDMASDAADAYDEYEDDEYDRRLLKDITEYSDRRLLQEIELVGESPSGIPIYSFKYLDGVQVVEGVMDASDEATYSGVLSEDLMELQPEAITMDPIFGYHKVDYSKIDVDFQMVEQDSA